MRKIRWKWALPAGIAVVLGGWVAIGPDGSTMTQQYQPCKIAAPNDAGTIFDNGVSLHLVPQTAWQPRGGKVQFTLEGKTTQSEDIRVSVCFGWETGGGATEESIPSLRVEVVPATDGKKTYAAVVPDLPEIPKRWPNRLWQKESLFHFFGGGSVPIAVMRVEASRIDDSSAKVTPLLDTMREVGVTSVWSARATALAAALFAFVVLSLAAHARNVPGHNRPVLGIISYQEGYASLSQFQLIVWSFVVGGGAVYVLALSGGLIDVPSQMLMLLGITGVTVLGARAQDSNTKSNTPKLADPTTDDVGGVAVVAPAPDSLGVSWNATKSRKYDVQYKETASPNWTLFAHGVVNEWCRITGLRRECDYVVQVRSTGLAGNTSGAWSGDAMGRTLAVPREPRWSDLIVTDDSKEIDVTKVQMLFFTLIAANFVLILLFNSYQIPTVPDGFLWLMGLSHGIYLSAKFVPA